MPERHAEVLRRLAPAARARGWWDAYAESLSPGYAGLLRLEAGSRALRTYCAVVPHALLMTPGYIRRVITATWQVPSTGRDRPAAPGVPAPAGGPRRTADRADDGVLDLRGGASTRRCCGARSGRPTTRPPRAARCRQLRHLVSVARWPNVSLRVLPFSAGIPPVSAGSFSLLESRATGAPDVVYLENKTRISFVDGEREVDRYVRDVAMLTSMALSEDDSVAFIEDVATCGR